MLPSASTATPGCFRRCDSALKTCDMPRKGELETDQFQPSSVKQISVKTRANAPFILVYFFIFINIQK
jgi:hypothetical protein